LLTDAATYPKYGFAKLLAVELIKAWVLIFLNINLKTSL
jgi:hypothetical protein